MNKGYIKIVLLIPVLFLSAFKLAAQQNYFIYLQTENKQPFYLKLDRKILSSSATGYLIVPKLQDTSYTFIIGFPKNEWAEQYVSYTVNKKDAGFLLKNFGDKGWGLFNLQTMGIVMAGTKPVITDVATPVKKEPEVTALVATVKEVVPEKIAEEKVVVKEEVKPVETEKKTEQKTPAVVADTLIAVKEVTADAKEPEKKPVVEILKKPEPVATTSQIKKLFSISSSEGSDMVYTDIINGHADTIRLFIPAEKAKVVIPAVESEKKQPEAIIEIPKKEEPLPELIKKEESNIPETKKQEPQKEIPVEKVPKFIDIEIPRQKTDTIKEKQPVEEVKDEIILKAVPEQPRSTPSARPVIINSDCKSLASDEDFLKLRKKMAAEDKEDEMINQAKKVFKSRCFTTEQVKNLSVLFLKDEGKYKFFDTVYPFVSDSYNFSTLQSQLTDEYFISRFKAMIRH
jgi:hypothetical protein